MRYRRAMMLLASAGGNRVPVIAQLVQADEDIVRDVIHRFNEIGLACLDPQWAGGRPRLLSTDDEDFVIQTATTRPAKLRQPFTRWSARSAIGGLNTPNSRASPHADLAAADARTARRAGSRLSWVMSSWLAARAMAGSSSRSKSLSSRSAICCSRVVI